MAKEVGKIYSAVDADELEAGDIVCCGNAKSKLYYETVIKNIRGDCEEYRFDTERNYYTLAKLICSKKHAEGKTIQCKGTDCPRPLISNPQEVPAGFFI